MIKGWYSVPRHSGDSLIIPFRVAFVGVRNKPRAGGTRGLLSSSPCPQEAHRCWGFNPVLGCQCAWLQSSSLLNWCGCEWNSTMSPGNRKLCAVRIVFVLIYSISGASQTWAALLTLSGGKQTTMVTTLLTETCFLATFTKLQNSLLFPWTKKKGEVYNFGATNITEL